MSGGVEERLSASFLDATRSAQNLTLEPQIPLGGAGIEPGLALLLGLLGDRPTTRLLGVDFASHLDHLGVGERTTDEEVALVGRLRGSERRDVSDGDVVRVDVDL